MGLSAVVRWLQGCRLVADSATNSTLIQPPEEAGCRALLAVLGRQVVDSLWEVVLHPATLKQDRALVSGRMKLGVHQLDHMALVGQSHQLVVAEPWHRCRAVALGSGIRPVRVEVQHPARRLQMQDRHGGLLSLSALRFVSCLVRLGQHVGGLSAVRMSYDVFAWRLKAPGVAKTELARYEANYWKIFCATMLMQDNTIYAVRSHSSSAGKLSNHVSETKASGVTLNNRSN